ncbi:gamma-glutamyl-gamma-aminobutyrate hydrolase family protein [Candidatus Gracilibacteria bacterium]|nr:gamma-glutamyl-gamma-aminobutyrate hydrolase family protein [Candidatus Gracilibacteria bacterium]
METLGKVNLLHNTNSGTKHLTEKIAKKTIGIIAAYKKESIDQINRVAFEYTEAVENAGGTPYIIPCNVKNIDSYIESMDAFIFPGGIDIDPAIYGEELNGSIGMVTKNDEFLLNFMQSIIESGKPILGICKGMQLMNIYFGGKLIQHLPNADFHDQYERQYESVDTAIVEMESFLHGVFSTRELPINSLHHQAIATLGKDLKIVAMSKFDGTIEGIKHIHLPLYGVQWHPECLKEQKRLFEWFVNL